MYAHAADQVPDRPPGLRVKPRGQLIEKDNLGIVDQCKSNKQPLFLASGEIHEPGAALVGEAELFEQPLAIDFLLPVKRCPQVYRLPDLDSLLQLSLLQLNPNSLLQLVDLAEGIEAENGNGAAVGLAKAFDALHCGGLSRAVGTDEPKDLPFIDRERRFIDSHCTAIGLCGLRRLR